MRLPPDFACLFSDLSSNTSGTVKTPCFVRSFNGEEIRLIGINAPEKGEKCYEEAKEFLEYFVLGKEITLERDVEDKEEEIKNFKEKINTVKFVRWK